MFILLKKNVTNKRKQKFPTERYVTPLYIYILYKYKTGQFCSKQIKEKDKKTNLRVL